MSLYSKVKQLFHKQAEKNVPYKVTINIQDRYIQYLYEDKLLYTIHRDIIGEKKFAIIKKGLNLLYSEIQKHIERDLPVDVT